MEDCRCNGASLLALAKFEKAIARQLTHLQGLDKGQGDFFSARAFTALLGKLQRLLEPGFGLIIATQPVLAIQSI